MLVFSVILIVVLLLGLAFFLGVLGMLLFRIADNLDDALASVKTINGHAEAIVPGLEHINRTGGVVAAALPLLYGFAERIVGRRHPQPRPPPRGEARLRHPPLPPPRHGRLPPDGP